MNIEKQVDLVKAPWVNSNYYDNAEKWTYLFWDKDTIFRRNFDRLDLSAVIELASGYGRHSEQVAPLSDSLTLVDVIDENLNKCRERLAGFSNVKYILGNGYNFQPIEDSSVTAIFSYDAMVHFSMDIIWNYLADCARVLRPGGMALFHHSNFIGPGAPHYGLNPHARNVMIFSDFCHKAEEFGLVIEDSFLIDWGGVRNLDRITLLRKKKRSTK